mgnify:CR=1 FL=1
MPKHRLKELRIEHDLTQRDICKAINVEQSTYSRIEKGARPLNSDIIIRLAEYYQISTDEVLGYTPKKTHDRVEELFVYAGQMMRQANVSSLCP